MGYFKKFLNEKLRFNWQLGLFLILLLGIPRFITVLQASKTGDYHFTSIIFVMMWVLPFVLLNKAGRREIGIKGPSSLLGVLLGIVLGGLFCILVWWLGDFLYQHSDSNWLVYISQSYLIPDGVDLGEQRLTFFIIFGAVSMIFSPIGEELMYRGVIHRCFVPRLGENKASIVDSSAFALTHVAHFGILLVNGNWEFRLVPALLWVGLTFLAARIFFFAKQKSGSILGAILSHASFNLTMTYFIFYHIF